MQVAVAEQLMQATGDQRQELSSPPPISHSHQPIAACLFNTRQLREFGTGDVAQCFGPAYAHYRGRRIPRLPNGDLLCASRVLHIEGTPGKVEAGASLVSEYDVPRDAWYYRTRDTMPLAVLMETALQPCGVLSTYLGSMLPYPDVDFYFRNLDGEAELLRDVDVRGKTITNYTRLLSSTNLPGIILQKFAFEMACEGAPFYRVTSSFGYFAPEAMRQQNGLDNGRIPHPTAPVPPANFVAPTRKGPLDFLDKVWLVPAGGNFGQGYIYAEAPISPADWFFTCHFYQDPVMPGSLGVEAMVQALKVYAEQQGWLRHLRPTSMKLIPNHTQTWKYRGQVTPDNDRIRLEVHLGNVNVTADQVAITANASLWKEDVRIYEVKGLGIHWGTPSEKLNATVHNNTST